MKKTLKIVSVIALVLAAAAYLFRDPLWEFAEQRITADMFVSAEAATFDPGPRVGSHFPGLRATYQGRDVTLVNEFAGPNGVILIALRSVDWCPFCKRQLIQLQQKKALFDANGIGLVAISYDAPEIQTAFSAAHGIGIPIISDTDTLTFQTLGILHPDYQPGHDSYGIPYPGMIIVDREGIVSAKLFVEQYSQRVDSREVLKFAKKALGVKSPLSSGRH